MYRLASKICFSLSNLHNKSQKLVERLKNIKNSRSFMCRAYLRLRTPEAENGFVTLGGASYAPAMPSHTIPNMYIIISKPKDVYTNSIVTLSTLVAP